MKSDVDIKHVEIKEHIANIFTNPLDSELFGYLRYKLGAKKMGILVLYPKIVNEKTRSGK